MVMKKPWQEHLFFIKGHRRHRTGATGGDIHTVNSTGWATGATICKPSKHIMSSYEWQQWEKRKMPIFSNEAATYAVWVVRKGLFTKSCLSTGSQVIWPKSISVLNEFKKGKGGPSGKHGNAPSDSETQGLKTSSIAMIITRARLITWARSGLSCTITTDQRFSASRDRFRSWEIPLDQIPNHDDELKLGQRAERAPIASANKAPCL